MKNHIRHQLYLSLFRGIRPSKIICANLRPSAVRFCAFCAFCGYSISGFEDEYHLVMAFLKRLTMKEFRLDQ